jgi:lipoprotein-releasing system ATP-binding protein
MTQVATHQVIIQNVAKSYPTAGQPLQVLTDVSLEMSGGDSLAVVGPSGSGKSTLLQILGTLDRPDSGTVSIDGEDPFRLSEQKLAAFRNHKIGFIFQDHHLLPQLSLIENVLVPALATGKPDSHQLERAKDLIDSVGLADRMGHLPSELSGGERERVAIARALLMQPSMILADEPTGNLDRRTADAVSDVLLDLQAKSNAILVAVTHSESLAAAMGDKRQLIDGKLVA